MSNDASFSESILKAALEYATESGWRITPLKVRDKVPFIRGWQKSASTDPEQIRSWLKGKTNNIGIATGAESGIIVLDIDVKSGGLSTLAQWFKKHGRFDDVPCQETGSICPETGKRGRHYFFRFPTDSKGQPLDLKNRANLPPGKGIKLKDKQSGIDIRANGGQVVAAPSIHPSGNSYQWVKGRSPAETEPKDMPKWLLDLIIDDGKPQFTTGGPKFRKPANATDTDSVINYMEFTGEGGRNDALFKYASFLRGQKGFGEQDLMYFVKRANVERCSPPIPETEVETIVKSVCGRYVANERMKKYWRKSNNQRRTFKSASPPKSQANNVEARNQDSRGIQSPEDLEPHDIKPAIPPTPPDGHHIFMENDDNRYFVYDLILAWMSGIGPESPKLVWRDGGAAYSENYGRYMKATEIRKFHQPDILSWLALKSRECIVSDEDEQAARAKKKRVVSAIEKAESMWKKWSEPCFYKHLSLLPDKAAIDGVEDGEKQKLAAAIYAILSKSIRVNDTTDQIPINTTVLQQADDTEAPGWKRVGKYGAYVRNPKKPLDASIGLRYDFVVQVGAPWLGELKRKRLTRLLGENQIAKTGVIKDARKSVRCLQIQPLWLNEYHGYVTDLEVTETPEKSHEP